MYQQETISTKTRRSERIRLNQVDKDVIALSNTPLVIPQREGLPELPYREAPPPNFTREPIHLPNACIITENSHLKSFIGGTFDKSPSIDDDY